MIIPLYKPYGSSSHLLAKQMGNLTQEKATHTGTLDPAAEGVILVLTGEDRYKKAKLSNYTKIYETQVLFGITTDTHDLLGLPLQNKLEHTAVSETQLNNALKEFVGTFTQQQPEFSAQRMHGKSAFDLAKEQKTFTSRSNLVTVHSIRLQSLTTISSQQIHRYHTDSIAKITGDFRQKDILHQWSELLSSQHVPEGLKLPLATLQIHCSKRTYIRSLVRDLSNKLALPATLFSLVRSANGPYSIKDCLCLI